MLPVVVSVSDTQKDLFSEDSVPRADLEELSFY